jgi:hypothetical protein
MIELLMPIFYFRQHTKNRRGGRSADFIALIQYPKICIVGSWDRGRNVPLVWDAPPSEPDERVYRIRLSG